MIRLRPSGSDEVLIKRVQDWYEPGPGVFIQSLTASFSPAMLFTGSTTGAWYDPSDITTLFQDAAGTTPVTAVGQPVGLMLDKSKGLGPELVSNGTFDSNINGWSVSPTYPNGTLSWVAGKLRITLSAAGWCFAYVNLTGLNTSSRFIVTTTTSSQTTQFAKVIASSGVGGNVGSLGYDSGNLAAPASIRSASIFPASTGSILIGGYGIAGQYVEFDNISVRELPGNHAFNSSGNSANFPVLQQDGTGRYYLAFNGTNQWLQTNSIDFTYGDKMFVSAGVRKLSDAAYGAITELSSNKNTNAGSFSLFGPDTLLSPGDFGFCSRGSVNAASAPFTSVAPITNVISGVGNISGDQAILRVNGAQAAISTADQGTGNFGNYPLYIGARAGSSLWFNGRLYQMVVAGKQASAAEITNTETFINQKTGAY